MLNSPNFQNSFVPTTTQTQPILVNSINEAFATGRSNNLPGRFLLSLLFTILVNVIFFALYQTLVDSDTFIEKELSERGRTTNGLLTELKPSDSRRYNFFYATYSWTVPDPVTNQPATFSYRERVEFKFYTAQKVGDSVAVRYLPNQPAVARLSSPQTTNYNYLGLFIFLGVFGFLELVALLLLVTTFVRGNARQKIARNGQRLVGRVTQVERLGGKLLVSYGFTSPQTGAFLQGQQKCKGSEAKRLRKAFGENATGLVNQPVTVFYLNEQKFLVL